MRLTIVGTSRTVPRRIRRGCVAMPQRVTMSRDIIGSCPCIARAYHSGPVSPGELLARGQDLYHECHRPPGAPPPLLLHGLGSSPAASRLQVSALSEHYTLITPDI